MSELLTTETKDIIEKMKPETRKLLEDMDDATYKEIASEIISIARPMILAKAHRDRPDREKLATIIGVTVHKGLRLASDASPYCDFAHKYIALLPPGIWDEICLTVADQLLALFPDIEKYISLKEHNKRLNASIDNTRKTGDILLQRAYKKIEQAKREERERIIELLQSLIEASAKVKEPAIKVKIMNILQALKGEK